METVVAFNTEVNKFPTENFLFIFNEHVNINDKSVVQNVINSDRIGPVHLNASMEFQSDAKKNEDCEPNLRIEIQLTMCVLCVCVYLNVPISRMGLND